MDFRLHHDWTWRGAVEPVRGSEDPLVQKCTQKRTQIRHERDEVFAVPKYYP
jgi:hypothetical protein